MSNNKKTTYEKAMSGDRDSSIEMYKDFVSQFEEFGEVSGESLSYVCGTIKDVIEADEHTYSVKGSQRRSDELMKALGLTGNTDKEEYRANLIHVSFALFDLTNRTRSERINYVIDTVKNENSCENLSDDRTSARKQIHYIIGKKHQEWTQRYEATRDNTE